MKRSPPPRESSAESHPQSVVAYVTWNIPCFLVTWQLAMYPEGKADHRWKALRHWLNVTLSLLAMGAGSASPYHNIVADGTRALASALRAAMRSAVQQQLKSGSTLHVRDLVPIRLPAVVVEVCDGR